MNEHYVINLGRQLGSGGKEIGEKLAREAEKQAKIKAAQEAKLAQAQPEKSGAQKKMQENVANADTPQAENLKDNDNADSVREEQMKAGKGGTEA